MNKLLFVLNAGWYFDLHWKERAINAVNNNYDVYVALPECSEELICSYRDLGITILQFEMNRTSLGVISEITSILSLRRIIMKVKPDIVHSVTIKPNLYSTILCRLFNIPLTTTYAGLGTLRVSQKISHKLVRLIVFHGIKVFTIKSKSMSLFENNEDLLFFQDHNYVPKNRLVRVYGAGVDLKKFSYSNVPPSPHCFTVLFASRLLKNKGLELIIHSCENLREIGIPIRLVVAGIVDTESPFAFSTDELEDLFRNDVVHWLGQRDDIPELISKSNVVVLPTTYGEGVPRILIEACAVGRPIVTTRMGGCNDICVDGENGLLISCENSHDLEGALKKLHSNYQLSLRMGLNGRRIVEDKFSNTAIFTQNLELYEYLLS